MKLILLDDVKTLGIKGAVVDVAEGYARNFLLPRGLAAEASKGELAKLAEQKKAQTKRDAETLATAQALKAQLESKTVPVAAKSGENGKLFGAITSSQIAESVKATFGVDVDRHKIELKESLKSVGVYNVPLRIAKNLTATLKVEVVSK